MLDKVYIVTDLGPGDGGKGGVVHRIATLKKATCVIKRGGAQGSHGVRNSVGQNFNFSQWGCGTFENIPSFLSSQMIVSPEGLLNEAKALEFEAGVKNPFSLLTMDKDCLCATPFHGIASHLKELARLDNPRGTIGTGVGEAYRDSLTTPELAIYIRDLFDPYIDQRLEAVVKFQRESLRQVIDSPVMEDDKQLKQNEINLLFDDGFLNYTQKRFREVSRKIRLSSIEEVLSKSGIAVIESSHGVINDSELGFKPHVSAIRTVPFFANDLLHKSNFKGEIVNIGVFRAYAIRHGAGPLPTFDPSMSEELLPGSHKTNNRWQGNIRTGALDINQLRLAVELSQPISFDGLAVTWFDQIKRNGSWKICDSFDGEKPIIKEIPIPNNISNHDLYDLCAEVIEKFLSIPVRMVSFGPTETDKILK